MSPTPSNVTTSHLDMSLRDLLMHMMHNELNHVVLVIPDVSVQVSVTVASVPKTKEITKQIERILS